MLEELAAQVSQRQLESVRAQVQPGEVVAIYQREGAVRVVLVGSRRLETEIREELEGVWRLLGAVAVEEDGERALPVRCA